MTFDFSGGRRLVQEQVRQLFRDACPVSTVRTVA